MKCEKISVWYIHTQIILYCSYYLQLQIDISPKSVSHSTLYGYYIHRKLVYFRSRVMQARMIERLYSLLRSTILRFPIYFTFFFGETSANAENFVSCRSIREQFYFGIFLIHYQKKVSSQSKIHVIKILVYSYWVLL